MTFQEDIPFRHTSAGALILPLEAHGSYAFPQLCCINAKSQNELSLLHGRQRLEIWSLALCCLTVMYKAKVKNSLSMLAEYQHAD